MAKFRSLRGILSSFRSPSEGLESLESRQMLAVTPVSASFPASSVSLEWNGETVPHVAGSWLVSFNDVKSGPQAELLVREAATRLGITVSGIERIGLGYTAKFNAPDTITSQAAKAVAAAIPGVSAIEPDLYRQTTAAPNDLRYSEQWHLRNTGQSFNVNSGASSAVGADINVLPVWDQGFTGSKNVIVAVVDSGLETTHPDLAPNIFVNPGEIAGDRIDNDGNGFVDDVNGWDFGENDAITNDPEGHGTQVAGLIGAKGNNTIGVSGVNWDVTLLPVRIGTDIGNLSTSAIIAGNDYIVMMKGRGFNIVASNNSYGGRGFITGEEASFQRLANAGVTPIISAGNASTDNDRFAVYPANFNIPVKIVVAATDESDGLTDFSNTGLTTVDLGAPGSPNIWTTFTQGRYTGSFSGTSAAAPIVAGAYALLKSIRPDASPTEIKNALLAGSKKLPSLQGLTVSGGRLDVAKALQVLNTAGPVLTEAAPGPITNQLDSNGAVVNTISLAFSTALNGSLLNTSSATLVSAGNDGNFGTSDDFNVPISAVTFNAATPKNVTLGLNLAGFAASRLPLGNYRLTLSPTSFRDIAGNQLNGNTTTGIAEVYNFQVRASTADSEPNDTLLSATPVAFSASGDALITGLSIGNGVQGNLDIDLYRVDVTGAGQINAEVIARRLTTGSTLDGFLRLFNARGEELASNDQRFGDDPSIDFYVPNGGSYYLGISGFGNNRYNPNFAGSGAAQSLGAYSLKVNVRNTVNDRVNVPYVTATSAPARPSLPAAIPTSTSGATQGITTSFIVVTDTRSILDLNVRVNISHSFVSDLRISLIGPDNTEVILSDRRGSNGQDYGTRTVNSDGTVTLNAYTEFDDEAGRGLSDVGSSAPFSGSFRSDAALGGFDAKAANGIWTLRINDTTALNSGQLWDWSLSFAFSTVVSGPFESNDTIATANFLGDLRNGSSTSRDAFIGDGGFGNLDRDIFSFTVNLGDTLTALVSPPAETATTPAGTLNTALRLFDSTGRQLLLSNPTDSLTSRIDGFIFAQGGTYYLSVSEGNNIAYNPLAVSDGTGVPASTTGDYLLQVSVAVGVSDPSVVLSGANVNVGLNPDGLFGASTLTGRTNLTFRGQQFLQNNGAQFLGGLASSNNFSNSSAGGSSLPFSLTSSGDTFNNTATAAANFNGLKVERRLSYGKSDEFIAIDLTLRNTTSTSFTNVQWMEGFNPDQGVAVGATAPGTSTLTDLAPNGKFVSARVDSNVFTGGLTVALAAPNLESRARAAALNPQLTFRDPQKLLEYINANPTAIDPDGASVDRTLALHLSAGNLAPGGSTTFRYFILFGASSASVDTLYAQINAGTGSGHLTRDPMNPATEVLQTGGAGTSVATLPYKAFYPEGFAGSKVFTFVPITNPNSEAAKVVVIARYEDQGDSQPRDQILGSLTIPAQGRSGLTLTTPELFASGSSLFRPGSPYAVEVRSSLPVSAIFSHYDLEQLARPAAVGEAFTSQTNTTWSFGRVSKFNPGATADQRTFLLFYNTTTTPTKVTATFYASTGGTPIVKAFNLDGLRRGGISINDLTELAVGNYGVTLTSDVPIVASLSRYNVPNNSAEGVIGNNSTGATAAVVPEGQFGLNSTQETLGVVNTNTTTAQVTFAFVFQNGTTYRQSLQVNPNSFAKLEVADLPSFPAGTPYAITYSSNIPVSLSVDTEAFNDSLQTSATSQAYTLWGFGEGFRPADGSGHPGVIDYLRVFNPSANDAVMEITIVYDDGPTVSNRGETFRRTVPGRTLAEFKVEDFITGSRKTQNSFFGLQVKSPTPVVAYMGHFDKLFPGAFGTLGTPLGISQTIT
jgi:subtilisin-like proprotein convertase family protein